MDAVFKRSGVSGSAPAPLSPHAGIRTSREGRLHRGGRRNPRGQPRHDPPLLCEVDTGISEPSGRPDSENPRHRFGTDGRTGAYMLKIKGLVWWPGTESNRRRQPFQGCALPTELPGRWCGRGWNFFIVTSAAPSFLVFRAPIIARFGPRNQRSKMPIRISPIVRPVHNPAAPQPRLKQSMPPIGKPITQ